MLGYRGDNNDSTRRRTDDYRCSGLDHERDY
jgi:hypothetical protein